MEELEKENQTKISTEKLEKAKIPTKEIEDKKKNIVTRVMLTAIASIVVPWLSVVIAYFTRPVGFYCRSKYLTILCSIWSFNSVLACILHWHGEKSVRGHRMVNGYFTLCGIIIESSFCSSVF